jgi:hypothetical protein
MSGKLTSEFESRSAMLGTCCKGSRLGARSHGGRCDMLEREEGLTYKRDGDGCLLVGGGDVVL